MALGRPLALSHPSTACWQMTSVGLRPVSIQRRKMYRLSFFKLRSASPPLNSFFFATGAPRICRTVTCGIVTSISSTISTWG
jgi:hypothetical protein